MVDCMPACLQRTGTASAALKSEQIGVTDDLGSLRHFFVLSHPEGVASLASHLRPVFRIELVLTSSDDIVTKHPATISIDLAEDTVVLHKSRSSTPYLTFSVSRGMAPTLLEKTDYFDGDKQLLKVRGVGSTQSQGCGCCGGGAGAATGKDGGGGGGRSGVSKTTTSRPESVASSDDRRTELSTPFEVELFFGTQHLRDYVASILAGLGQQDTLEGLDGKSVVPVQNLKVFVGTWNFGNNQPPSDLSPWIPRSRFDLYAIGMQESPGENIKLVSEYLGDEYVMVKDEVMGVIRLAVMIRKTMVQYIEPSSVESFHVASGILGGMGINKGGVCVALRYRDMPILFVSSHLAARATAKRNRRRNKDVRNIIENMAVGLKNVDAIHQYNVFWLGDLNYRITLPWEECVDLVRKQRWSTLHHHDQLLVEKAGGRVFCDFQELPLDFPPTYKYIDFKHSCVWEPVRANGAAAGPVVGHICRSEEATESSQLLADRYRLPFEVGHQFFFMPADPRGLRREYTRHKMQTPSWTDRILYRPLPGTRVAQDSAGCVDEIQTSDHSPVFATYSVRVPLPPPVDVQFLKCTIQVGNVQLLQPRYAQEPYGGIHDDVDDDLDDDSDDEIGGGGGGGGGTGSGSGGGGGGGAGAGGVAGGGSGGGGGAAAAANGTRTKLSRKASGRRARTSVFGRKLTGAEADPVLAMHLPFLRGITKRTAYKTPAGSAESSRNSPDTPPEQRGFNWHTRDIPEMGPFFTKMEYLENRRVIFRVQGNHGHGSAGNTIGYCSVSLAPMVERRMPVKFEATLLRGGQPAGKLIGTILIKWLDSSNQAVSLNQSRRRSNSIGAAKAQEVEMSSTENPLGNQCSGRGGSLGLPKR